MANLLLWEDKHFVKTEVLTVASMKMTVFWVVATCSLASSIVRVIALMMEAASTSVTSVNFYQTERRSNPEDSHLHKHFVLAFRNFSQQILPFHCVAVRSVKSSQV
jgi:hypothetical protein